MSLKENRWLRKAVYKWRNWRNKHNYTVGKGNKIINQGGIRINSLIQISGDGNKVVIEKGAVLLNSLVKISGNNNQVVLKGESYVSGAELWVEDNDCLISVGERTFIGHHSHLACTEEGSQLVIGNDGMISSYVQIRTGDSHSILDNDGNRINYAQNVTIGNHCWIGEGAKVFKGVELGEDLIVSSGAIVTKSFGKKLLIGGVPANVLKENVTWESRRL